MYTNPDIESSYHQYDIGRTIYDQVIKYKPNTIVEFGCLYGYSTVAMGLALKELGRGKIICYDLWDAYPYKHSNLETTKQNIIKYGVEDFVEFRQADYYEWLKNPEPFDLMHLDISNDGDTIVKTYEALKGSIILFEGGSLGRDSVEWMKKYNKVPINSIRHLVPYSVLNVDFPSLSIIHPSLQSLQNRD
jgi:hypothetical protein